GGTWAAIDAGLDPALSYDRVYASPHASDGGPHSKLLIAGSSSAPTLYRSDDGGDSWDEITSDLPAPDSGLRFEGLNFDPDPLFPNGIYAVFSGAHPDSPHTFFKSSDPPETSTGGITWAPRPHPGDAIVGPDMHALYVSPVNHGRVVV